MKKGKRSLVSTFVALMMGLAGLGFFVSEAIARPYHGYRHHTRHYATGSVEKPTEPTWDPWTGYTHTTTQTGRVRTAFVPGDRSTWQSNSSWSAQQVSWSSNSSSSVLGQARSFMGMSENGNRSALARTLGVDPVRTPWCAAWANAVLRRSGYHSTGSNMARSFYSYGHRSNGQIGDIAVLRGGHHVGFVAGYSYRNGRRYVQVLGGNQHNQVRISSFPASGAAFRDPS